MDQARLDYARAAIPAYRRHFPEILDEIRGIAEGQRTEPARMEGFLLSMYSFAVGNHCSCVAYSDEDTVLFGRNSDFLTAVEPFCDSPMYRLEGAYGFVGATTAWSEMEDGVNEHGLAARSDLYVSHQNCCLGLTPGCWCRYVLERCRTVEEAIEAIRKLPVGSAQAITLADRSGAAAVVECNCESLEVIRREMGERCFRPTILSAGP